MVGTIPFRTNSRPLYLQAAEALRAYIQQSDFHAGDMLPSEEALARELGISRLTLREALGYLENDGLIQRKRGVGTLVCEPPPLHFAGGLERFETFRSLAGIAGLRAETVARSVETVPACQEWAEQLEIPPGTELVRVRATQAIDGIRAAYFDGLTPLAGVNLAGVQRSDGSLLEYFVEQGSQMPTHTRSSLYAVSAGQELSRELAVPEGTAVLQLLELWYLGNRQPVALANNHFLTHCFNFFISRRVDSQFSAR